jgi:hypothetical protein
MVELPQRGHRIGVGARPDHKLQQETGSFRIGEFKVPLAELLSRDMLLHIRAEQFAKRLGRHEEGALVHQRVPCLNWNTPVQTQFFDAEAFGGWLLRKHLEPSINILFIVGYPIEFDKVHQICANILALLVSFVAVLRDDQQRSAEIEPLLIPQLERLTLLLGVEPRDLVQKLRRNLRLLLMARHMVQVELALRLESNVTFLTTIRAQEMGFLEVAFQVDVGLVVHVLFPTERAFLMGSAQVRDELIVIEVVR